MKKLSITFGMLLVLFSCGNKEQYHKDVKIVAGNQFFQNSKRSTLSEEDTNANGIAQFNGCTGFFLKNNKGANYIVSARHCFEYTSTNWCKNEGMALDVYNNKLLKCVNVVVGDSAHDIVIMEFESSVRDRGNDFELADFQLYNGLKLSMLGYPGDPYNPEEALKLTEHCWVQSATSVSVYDIVGKKDDKVFTHNCSTYGGNSGGPIFIEGTRIVVGLPDSYLPEEYGNSLSSDTAQGVLASEFVEDFREKIKKLQISLATKVSVGHGKYFSEGKFTSSQSQCFVKIVETIYNTNDYVTTIAAEYGGDCFARDKYKCDESGVCIGDESKTIIKIINKNKINYYRESQDDAPLVFSKN